jgi:hypothetical protein
MSSDSLSGSAYTRCRRVSQLPTASVVLSSVFILGILCIYRSTADTRSGYKKLRASQARRSCAIAPWQYTATAPLQCACRGSIEQCEYAYLSLHHGTQCNITRVHTNKLCKYRNNVSSPNTSMSTPTSKGYIHQIALQYRRPCRASIPRCGVFVTAVSWSNQKACRRPLAGRIK